MTEARGTRASGRRRRWWLRRTLVAVPLLLVAYVAVTFVQVWRAAGWEADHDAEAILVLGAAQYDGTPSPALRGRLDHAFDLWTAERAPTIVLTGSKQEGDRFTEAYAGFRYLRKEGVPEKELVVVATGTNTFESVAASIRVLRKQGLDRVILVSDAYHSFRLVGIAEEVGFVDPQVSSTGSGVTLSRLVRETAVVSVGRVIGYRRATRLFGS